MFEAWFPAFTEVNGSVCLDTEASSGDNGTPAGKDLGYLLEEVITDDGKLRIVQSV